MPRSTSQTDKPSSTEEPSWDGSPLTRFSWQKELPRRLTRANQSFKTLCELGYVIERGKVICASPTHMLHLYHNNVARQTFQNPCNVLQFKLIDDTLKLEDVPDESASRYTIAPEVIHATDSLLFEEITDTISNTKRRDDYYLLTDGSGLALLKLLTAELSDQSPEIGAWAANEIASLQLAGISSPTVAAFDEYRRKYEDLNGQLDERASDASLAAHYFAQVRRLGDMIATKLKLRMTTEAATGDLIKTVSAITAVLNEEEASSSGGRALFGKRDPNPQRGKGKGRGKGAAPAEKRTWDPNKDSPCNVCNGEVDGGRHLRKDCPRRDNSSQTSTGGRGGARAASCYPQFSSYDEGDSIVLSAQELEEAFSDGLPQQQYAESDRSDEQHAPLRETGAARVARTTPITTENTTLSSDAPPVTPPPRPESTRSSVEKLDSSSPVHEIRALARELRKPINLSVGGKDRRTKFDILQDLRKSVGLDALEPPMGIPLSSSSHTQSSSRHSFTAPAPPESTPSTAGKAAASEHDQNNSMPGPPPFAPQQQPAPASDAAWPWQGGPLRSLVCTVADGKGGVVLRHTFSTPWAGHRDAAPSTFTSPVDGPTEVLTPPSGSVWLGSRPYDGKQLWGQPDGQLVCSTPSKPSSSNSRDEKVARSGQSSSGEVAPTTGLGVSSLAAIIAAFSALWTIQAQNSQGGYDAHLPAPPDSGTTTRELVCPCLVCLWALAHLFNSIASQASAMARRGRRALLARRARRKYKPPKPATSVNPFEHAATSSRRLLRDAIYQFSSPLVVTTLFAQWLIFSYLSHTAYAIRLLAPVSSKRSLIEPPLQRHNLWSASPLPAFRAALRRCSPQTAFLPCVIAVRLLQGDRTHMLLLFLAFLLSGSAVFLFSSIFYRFFQCAASAVHSKLRVSRPRDRLDDSPPSHLRTVPPPAAMSSCPSPDAPPERRGRAALSSGAHDQLAHKGWKSRFPVSRWLSLIVDSGCTWHIHNRRDDLVNLRACRDTVIDAHGREARCDVMGDLPLVIRDECGREFSLLLRGVRLAEGFSDTLISVNQLWASSGVDTIFRDVRQLVFTHNAPLRVPFRRVRGSYTWEVGLLDKTQSARFLPTARAASAKTSDDSHNYKGEVHSAGAHSHIHSLPANGVAAVLHRRLHVGLEHIKRLARHSVDAPSHVSSATHVSCEGCAEANATRLSHSSSRYQPSHVGRLIHADIVGPFVNSYAGSHKYALVLVDDHSRYKSVKFLRAKSDAPAAVRTFVSELNAGVSTRSPSPVRVVGSLHTDNAGEFLSREFKEFLDDSLVAHTTCPPHVHQLNGVAERAIRSILELARSYLTSSNVSVHHWPAAFEMAVDVLNRTTGPPNSNPGGGPSSYEILTGVPPRVMNIMPFGCRAFIVKPRSQYSKTTLEPRAWVGFNLGRCASIPGAYRVFVPSVGRIVQSSDVYFLESFFPCRPRGAQLDDSAPPIPTPAPAEYARAALLRARTALSAAFGDAVSRLCPSRRVLLLFSGPHSRPDGMAAFFEARGVRVDQVDNRVVDGGGSQNDILNDQFFTQLLKSVRSGTYGVVFAAPPCSTYSVSRYFPPKSHLKGPPPVRSRAHILGLPSVPPAHRLELARANEITRRTAILLMAAHRSGAEFIVENPVDRGDASNPLLFQFAEHGPIWLDPYMQELSRSCSTESATFAQCMFGAGHQKYTTLWFTSGLSPALRPLRQLVCTHAPGSHSSAAGGVKDLESLRWNSEQSAAYPPDFNLFIVDAVVNFLASALCGDESPAPLKTKPSLSQPSPAPLAPVSKSTPRDAASSDATADSNRPSSDTVSAAPSVEPPVVIPEDPPPVMRRQDESNDATDAEDTTSPTDRRTRTAAPIFRRGLGPIRLRPRSHAGRSYIAQSELFSKDPTNHNEAMFADAQGWGNAEASEIDNHERANSWDYVPRSDLPAGRRIVRLTWVYKTKRDGRQKARLCVQGCSQVAGVDYHQTFCAAMRSGSLRVLCSIAAKLGLHMRRWDFVAAYLQGALEDGEVVFCSPAPGYATCLRDGKVRMVPADQGDGVPRLCKVTKPVYGMAQAGRRWQRSIFPWLLDWGKDYGFQMKQSQYDTCVFHCSHTVHTPSGPRDEVMYIGCYVDDLFILSSHNDEHSLYHQFTSDLQSRWEVEDEGEVADLLNVQITREGKFVKLCQTSYIDKLMTTYAPEGKPVSPFGSKYPLKSQQPSRVPANPNLPQQVLDATAQIADDVDSRLLKDYQSLVGALLYCAVNTRPDIAYAVGMLCRAMGKPTPVLYECALQVLYYLHHHREVGLRYECSEQPLSGMSDADWAVRNSTSGFVFSYCEAAISWGSKKQPSIALSSCEAEIMALSEAAKEGVYLRNFLQDLGVGSSAATALATDNSAAQKLSYNPEHHERVKHIDRRHFYIRDLVEDHVLTVPFVATAANMADLFTKPLTASVFFPLRNAIMNHPSSGFHASTGPNQRAGGSSRK